MKNILSILLLLGSSIAISQVRVEAYGNGDYLKNYEYETAKVDYKISRDENNNPISLVVTTTDINTPDWNKIGHYDILKWETVDSLIKYRCYGDGKVVTIALDQEKKQIHYIFSNGYEEIWTGNINY